MVMAALSLNVSVKSTLNWTVSRHVKFRIWEENTHVASVTQQNQNETSYLFLARTPTPGSASARPILSSSSSSSLTHTASQRRDCARWPFFAQKTIPTAKLYTDFSAPPWCFALVFLVSCSVCLYYLSISQIRLKPFQFFFVNLVDIFLYLVINKRWECEKRQVFVLKTHTINPIVEKGFVG